MHCKLLFCNKTSVFLDQLTRLLTPPTSLSSYMPPKQTTWSDTSSIVGQSFRLNKAIAHKIPSSIRFTEDDKKLFFLGGCGRSTLFSVDLEQPVASPDIPLEHTQFFDNSYVPKSREEEVGYTPLSQYFTTLYDNFQMSRDGSFIITHAPDFSCYEKDRGSQKLASHRLSIPTKHYSFLSGASCIIMTCQNPL